VISETPPIRWVERRGGGVAQMLRDAPEFSSLPPHVLRLLAWAYRYTDEPEDVPTRDAIMRAMTALAALAAKSY
jgi:hypothetical protein